MLNTMIDHRQIRAARALLNWTQSDLARAAAMATSSVKNIESESSSARRETLAQIHSAFDDNGIEFMPGTGVRLKNDIVAVHDGRRATAALLDSIYTHVQTAPEREVCITGLDEAFSVDTDGEQMLTSHIDRLARAGVRERILLCEGDTRFLNAPECYRWLPRAYFTRNAPIYVYGDRIASPFRLAQAPHHHHRGPAAGSAYAHDLLAAVGLREHGSPAGRRSRTGIRLSGSRR